ncbi:MAG: transposase [Patescibacteria group bacterium]|nr:transposase [Patescibacteria group bacterium]
MSIRKANFAINEYHHLYNRGNSKQEIFLDQEDYNHLIKLLYLCNSKRSITCRDISKNTYDFDREEIIVFIGAYCLMPNHFHLLIKEKTENGISKFMQKVSTAYSMYFNKKYKRTGGLFEGKFKSKHLSTDRYLKYIFSYIHLNPIKLIEPKWKKVGIKNIKNAMVYLRNYQYSSYFDYLNEDRIKLKILNKTKFPNYFPSKNTFEKEIVEWLNYKEPPTP